MMRWRLARPSGPAFLYHVMSIKWEAIFCPVCKRAVGLVRCIRGLK